jgi:hypothetical protein
MSKPVVEVKVLALGATNGGCTVFLGNENKVFVMFVDQSVGTAVTMFRQDTPKERPRSGGTDFIRSLDRRGPTTNLLGKHRSRPSLTESP